MKAAPVTFLFALTLSACGASNKEVEAPPAAEPAPEESTDEDEMSAEEAALLEQIEESAGEADIAADAAGEEEAKREIVYRVSPEGLRIEIEGAEFRPTAEMVKVAGGYGIKLNVEAKTDAPVVLFSSEKGPLAFGGYVQGGEKKKFGDQRGGGSEVTLNPGAPVNFDRTWPAEGEAGLKAGESIELHVGLWGFGTDSESRRPVNRFVVVKMKAGGKPEIEPPAQ